MTQKNKRRFSLASAILLIILGNRVFNHVSAWGGVLMITAGILMLIMTMLNKLKPNEYEKEN